MKKKSNLFHQRPSGAAYLRSGDEGALGFDVAVFEGLREFEAVIFEDDDHAMVLGSGASVATQQPFT